MLVLSRSKNQAIKIGDDVEIILLEVRGNRAKIGINAPGTTKVLRSELPPDASNAPPAVPDEPRPAA